MNLFVVRWRRLISAGGSRRSIAMVGAILLALSGPLRGATAADFLAGSVAKTGAEPADLAYRYLVPAGYDATRQYPLIVFLHGSGERGSDNAAQLNNDGNGSLQWVSAENQAEFPAFMLAPQLGGGGSWDDLALAQTARAIATLSARYSIDLDRIYVTGLSLGGAGTYGFVSAYPDLFAAAVPMSAFMQGDAARICGTPLWAFHAADDPAVPIGRGDTAVEAVRLSGGRVIYTRYNTGGHVIWPTAYGDPRLLPWLMAQRRHQTVVGSPIVRIESPAARLPALPPQPLPRISGSADFAGGGLQQVYWTYSSADTGDIANLTAASLANGTDTWSVSLPPPDANSNYVMVYAVGPVRTSATVAGGYTSVNDLVWLVPTSATLASPNITIASPAIGTVTMDTRVDLAGKATAGPNQVPVQQVTWVNDRGGQGVARLYSDESWAVLGVSLQPGANTITVTARNRANVWASASIMVHCSQAAVPVIAAQPQSVTVAPGARAVLAVTATADIPLTYQWLKDGQPIAGATATALTLNAIRASDAGNYAVAATDSAGTVVSTIAAVSVSAAPLPLGRLRNLSARGVAAAGSETLIAGFTVDGAGQLPVLVRGAGPALRESPFAIPGALADPLLRLHRGTVVVAENDNWGGEASVAAIAAAAGAFPFNPAGRDAALVTSAGAGTNSAEIVAPAGQSGIVLAEIYDASATNDNAPARLTNLSVRARAGKGNEVLIAGFVIGGPGPLKVLLRAVGPTLSSFAIDGVLADPVLELHSSNGLIQENDNWSDATNASDLIALNGSLGFPLPAGSKDAAVLVALVPGNYSVVVRGAGGKTGVALLEVYEAP